MCVVGFKSITCQADQWREDHPAQLPPATWPVADHVLNVLIKPFSSCGTKTGGQKEACIFLALRLRLQDYKNRPHEATKKKKKGKADWTVLSQEGKADKCNFLLHNYMGKKIYMLDSLGDLNENSRLYRLSLLVSAAQLFSRLD